MPALTKATRGNVKKDDKNIALVLEQSLQEEENKKEQEEKSCQEEERSLAEALRLSLEEVTESKALPSVVPTVFFDRPDNYVMLDGKRTLSSASYLPNNPRGPSPFQPWLITSQGMKPVTLVTLGGGITTLETGKTKALKPSLNWGQGLITKSQPTLSLPSPVILTVQPVELSSSTETRRIDGTSTEVPSVLPESVEPFGNFVGESTSSTPEVENGALNSSTTGVEPGVHTEESESPPSGTTDGMGESSVFDGDLRLSGSEANSLHGSIDGGAVDSNHGAESRSQNSSSEGDSEYDVRKVCGVYEPDIKLESPDTESSSATTSRSSNTASSSESSKPVLISQAVITKLLRESQSWSDEDGVVQSMKSAGLSDSSGPRAKPVAILPKTLAGLMFKSRGTFYDKEQLAMARIKNEQEAEANFNKRLGKLYVDHNRKVKVAEQELTTKLKKVDELTETLEKRLEASRILDEENVEFNKHQIELAQQNEQLRRDVLRLKDKLRAISNGTLELNDSSVLAAPGHESSHSSHSFASSLQSIPPNDGKKRDRSPNDMIRGSRNDDFKKPRSQRELIDIWNKEGTQAVHGFCESRRAHMKTQSEIVLENWRTRLEQALTDFKAHFSTDGRLVDTMATIQEKNHFSHISFLDLQREFEIPTVEEGRTISVHFYYGQLVGVINNVLTSRRTFATTLRDADKIDAFIKYKRSLDPLCPYVARFFEAQRNLKDIETDARHMHDFFLGRVQAMQVLHAPSDDWISHASYLELQSLSGPTTRDRRLALGEIIGKTKRQFTLYYELKARHTVIDFYSDARTHHRNAPKEQPFKHGGRPQRHR